ncbi:hypothetical protein [Candidatus Enterococcus murrayae]|uniref:Uncharacterized protein n=1 Tax=Candidatus Enterococcus murrayae TaxID=2815321 RepID=A0ABS3HN67_9ENTE|nr:hypothetical protein [Enterococcus sp. MJM16]MBO0454896.1 hypothetical protein [Enterococcus sp. MJM16]
MIGLDYYFYSDYLEKDMRSLAFYLEKESITRILCLILPKEETINSFLYSGKLGSQPDLLEQTLLLIPDANEFYYAETGYQAHYLEFAKHELNQIFQNIFGSDETLEVVIKRWQSI